MRYGRLTHCTWRSLMEGGGDDGQALVEISLTLPLLLLMLLGAVELARVTYAAIEVSNAAKAGAQYGSQGGAYSTDVPGIQTAAQNEALWLYNLNTSNFNTTASLSFICSDGTASDGSNVSCSSSQIEQILTVQTVVTYDPLIYFPGQSSGSHTFTLIGNAEQKVFVQ